MLSVYIVYKVGGSTGKKLVGAFDTLEEAENIDGKPIKWSPSENILVSEKVYPSNRNNNDSYYYVMEVHEVNKKVEE